MGLDLKSRALSSVTVSTNETTTGFLKSYTFKQGSRIIGVIDIPKDLVVFEGSVVENPDGYQNGTYIRLVIANQKEPLYINVGKLVDIYTAQQNATNVQININPSTREISATIVKGSIGTAKLADAAVTTDKIADKNITLAKLADDVADGLSGKIVYSETEPTKLGDNMTWIGAK